MKSYSIYKTAGCLILFFLVQTGALQGQNSDRTFRRSAIHNANLVKTGFGNWGVIGQPSSKPRGAWIFENNGYIGDVSPMMGAEGVADSVVFHSVVVTPVARPTQNQEESSVGKFWGFEPDGRYFNNAQQQVALSTNRNSWPPFWPDKLDEPGDPGWPGSWNGFFGRDVFNADQESYFVMDDNNDEEFNFELNNDLGISFKSDSVNTSRNGLGLEVKVRGLQWAQFLAQDAIFWLYEITNTGTTDYTRTVFGMLVGTYIGVTGSTPSGNEFDDDYSFFDVEKDMTFTADFDDNVRRNPLWVGSDVGVVAYAFLESPGNPFDGIDNDGDAENSDIPTGSLFTDADFQERLISAGDELVLIDRDFNRIVVTVPATDTVFVTRGGGAANNRITIRPGVTRLTEGNLIRVNGLETINPNASDGIDNDLDGLIDENFQLHFRQIRRELDGTVLIDILKPVKFIDYLSGDGSNNPMIDEKRNDGIDNDNDWDSEFDDVGADGQADTGDFGEGDGFPTAGEPNFDQTDVDESDQIGLTSFEYFVPAGDIDLANDEELWGRMAPGLFDVPTSIQNNLPVNGEDGDFVYGSGYFPLLAKQVERFSLALVYGDGGGRNVEIEDLLKNRVTVQKIFDADYRFPQPPLKPTMTAVPGDGEVTLYWDRRAENSLDPVLREKDFEGYKIYRATDIGFVDAFKVTDGLGTVTGFSALQQFDLDNDIAGFFRPSQEILNDARGLSFFLGENTGLQHSFVDTDVDNGRTYYYAVVAYDRGSAAEDIFPSENTKAITRDDLSGVILNDINTAVVVPNAPVAGFVAPEDSEELEKSNVTGTGQVFFQIIDETAQTGSQYRVEFTDTAHDGVDNNNNWDLLTDDVGSDGVPDTDDADGTEGNGRPDIGEPNVDQLDKEELLVPLTYAYSVRNSTPVTEQFTANDTFLVSLENQNLAVETVEVRNSGNQVVDPADYVLDASNGKIKGSSAGSLGFGEFSITYQHYPVFESRNIQGSPFATETRDTDIFDGVQLVFNNTSERLDVKIDNATSGFNRETLLRFTFSSNTSVLFPDQSGQLRPVELLPHPGNYEIRFFDGVVDTTLPPPPIPIPLPGIPVNFEVWNTTDNVQVPILFTDIDRNQELSPSDQMIFFEASVNGELAPTWNMLFFVTSEDDSVSSFALGDTLFLQTAIPFRSGDQYTFSTVKARADVETARSNNALEQVRVVPNPYIVATPFEAPLATGVRGRGERRIDFIHLPEDARVHIFTPRGEHVVSLAHEGGIHNGVVSWNLKTKENLDIAYGMYLYVVESSIGTKRGKIGIIK